MKDKDMFPSDEEIKSQIQRNIINEEKKREEFQKEQNKKDMIFKNISALSDDFTQSEIREILAYIADKPPFEQKKYYLTLSKKTKLSVVELRNEATEFRDLTDNEFNFSNITLDEVRTKCYVYISQKNINDLTEFIVNWISSFNHIYCTQNDYNVEVWLYDQGCYYPNGKTKLSALIRKATREFYSSVLDNRVQSKIQADNFIAEDDFFNQQNVDFIPVENGLLNIIDLTLHEYDPNKIFFNKIPILFDPNAKCPTVDLFLRQITPNDVDLLEEIAGYLLYKDYPLHNWFLFNGGGRNGKGAFIRLIQKLIGSKNFCNVTLQDLNDEPYALGEINGKLLNAGGDIPSKTIETTGNIKSITGGDTVNAKRKFKTDLQMKPYAKHIFSANEIPDVKDTSDGFYDRIVLVEFTQRFLKQAAFDKIDISKRNNVHLMDSDIENRMELELSGFLNIALAGLHRLLDNKEFTYRLTMEETKLLYLRKSNNVVAFFQDSCVRDKSQYITKEDFRAAYQEWCLDQGYENQIMSDKQIFQTLVQNLGIASKRKLLPVEYIGESEQVKLEKVSVWEGLTLINGNENE